MLLTVAIICKNEEKNIARCLNSIFKCTKKIESWEVILSDSYSTDQTIEIAKNFPIKIVQLRKDWPHSPAAGRYTALRHAKGKYTLCLDADMELEPNFLEKGIEFLEGHLEAAAVTGILENLFHENKYKPLIVSDSKGNTNNLDQFPVDYEGRVKSIPGAGIFRTEAVLATGNFHPFLKAEEEYELCQRLRRKGFELWFIPIQIAKHYGYEQSPFNELKRRTKNGFMAGIGQMFNWSIKNGFIKENFRRFNQHILIGGYLWLLPIILLLSFFSFFWIEAWMAGVVCMIIAFVAKKRSMSLGIIAFLTKAIIGWNIWYMFPKRLPNQKKYPTDVLIINNAHKQCE